MLLLSNFSCATNDEWHKCTTLLIVSSKHYETARAQRWTDPGSASSREQ